MKLIELSENYDVCGLVSSLYLLMILHMLQECVPYIFLSVEFQVRAAQLRRILVELGPVCVVGYNFKIWGVSSG